MKYFTMLPRCKSRAFNCKNMNSPKAKEGRMNLRVPAELMERLEGISNKTGKSMSEIARWCLEMSLTEFEQRAALDPLKIPLQGSSTQIADVIRAQLSQIENSHSENSNGPKPRRSK